MSAGFTKAERDALTVAIDNRVGDIDRMLGREDTLPREVRETLYAQRAALRSTLIKLPRMRQTQ